MRLCPICHTEVSGIKVSSDDFIDRCEPCDVIVEGETIDSEELEQQKQQWAAINADEEINEETKWI